MLLFPPLLGTLVECYRLRRRRTVVFLLEPEPEPFPPKPDRPPLDLSSDLADERRRRLAVLRSPSSSSSFFARRLNPLPRLSDSSPELSSSLSRSPIGT